MEQKHKLYITTIIAIALIVAYALIAAIKDGEKDTDSSKAGDGISSLSSKPSPADFVAPSSSEAGAGSSLSVLPVPAAFDLKFPIQNYPSRNYNRTTVSFKGNQVVEALKNYLQKHSYSFDAKANNYLWYPSDNENHRGLTLVFDKEDKVKQARESLVKKTLSIPAVIEMEVTAYCPCKKCCGEFADGITASGLDVKDFYGLIVAAPAEYPFGTLMEIPGYGNATVQDRGGVIKGNKLDVFFRTHQEALNWGRQILKVKVYD